MLVDAMDLLRERHPDLRLVLVGGGEDEERVRDRVAALKLEDFVLMPGRVPHEDVPRWYGLMDLLVYPRLSRRITELVTPLKPLEAMAMEIPVIGSDVGGVREILQSCGEGSLFRSGSPADLARCVESHLQTPSEERLRKAKEVRAAVLRERSWERLLEPLLERYRSLVGDDESSPRGRDVLPAAAGT